MAVEMVRMQSDAVIVAMSAESKTQSNDAMPCHGEAQDGAYAATECTTCQVCHSPALQAFSRAMGQDKLQTSHFGRSAMVWVSADLTHLQKPPVS